MAGTKEIKKRIKSVKNTRKITKAMELVAASKMKRSVSHALSGRLYALYSWNLLVSLSDKLDEITHPFFNKNDSDKDLIVIITSNGGLCGAYNSQIIKKVIYSLKEKENVDIITVGKKGDNAMRRIGENIIASFLEIPDNCNLSDINPLSKMIIDEYKSGKYGKVYIAYTDFISALTQKANLKQLLPVSKKELKEFIDTIGEGEGEKEKIRENNLSYSFEGNTETLINSLAEKLTKMQIYQMILESNASEQSSRMMAMKNASEAAGEMIDSLTLVFNKARQAGITAEISEISAGMASIE